MAQVPGESSWSRVVRGHYYRLTFSFRKVLERIAAKSNVVGLIDIDSLTNANNVQQPEDDRAEALLDAILASEQLLKSGKKWFDALIIVMREISDPALNQLADELETALEIEEDSFTRSAFVIHPPVQRSVSLPKESPASRGENSEGDFGFSSDNFADRSSEGEESDNTSLFEFELPGFLNENELELIVDPDPGSKVFKPLVIEGVSPHSDQESVLKKQSLDVEAVSESIPHPSTTRSCMSEPTGANHSNAGIAFTYSEFSTLLPPYSTTSEEVSQEESSNSMKDEAVVKPLSERHSYTEAQKVHKLKKQPGIIVSQREKKIVSLSEQYGAKNREVEEVVRSKFELKKQSEKLQQEREAKADGHLLETRISELESEVRALQKELRENQRKKEKDISKLKKYFEQNYVKKVEDAQDSELLKSKLYEKPSHAEVFKVLLKHDLSNHWRTIGTLLGLSLEKLHTIEQRSVSEEGGLQEMTGAWVCLPVGRCSWKSLISAVKTVDRNKAQEIKRKILQ